jgi:hypothetical protein
MNEHAAATDPTAEAPTPANESDIKPQPNSKLRQL